MATPICLIVTTLVVSGTGGQLSVGGTIRGQSSATYHTSQGTYFVFRQRAISSRLTRLPQQSADDRLRVERESERPGFALGYNYRRDEQCHRVGCWCQGDGQLHGYDGDTGAVFTLAAHVMSGTRKWNSGIVARGSIYVANDNKVYAFRVPGGTPTPTPTARNTDSNAHCQPRRRLHSNSHSDGHQHQPPTATHFGSPTATPRPTPTPRSRATPRPRPTPPPRPTL